MDALVVVVIVIAVLFVLSCLVAGWALSKLWTDEAKGDGGKENHERG